jgi:hypothetical protein
MTYEEPDDEKMLAEILSTETEDSVSHQTPLPKVEEVLDLEGCGCIPAC